MEQSIEEIWHGQHFTHLRDLHLERRGNEITICSTCPDWKYRSWNYNYWKVLKDAEEVRTLRGEGEDPSVSLDAGDGR
jgi:hypothetical protein